MTAPTVPKDGDRCRRPPRGSVERWAWRYVRSHRLQEKIAPPPPPCSWEAEAIPRRLTTPGRPPELDCISRSRRQLSCRALRDPEKRAEVLHIFWHHELQAAELMAWAILAYADAPRSFRQGLLKICRDEIRHMKLYQGEIERLGYRLGDFAVRDWFWDRVPACRTPLHFVALMGMGLEGGNLDHSQRYVNWFEEAGDGSAARVQSIVAREEIGHVQFALRWFAEWNGSVGFEDWRASLTPPLSPRLFRDKQLNRQARMAAGMTSDFLDAFDAYRDAERIDESK